MVYAHRHLAVVAVPEAAIPDATSSYPVAIDRDAAVTAESAMTLNSPERLYGGKVTRAVDTDQALKAVYGRRRHRVTGNAMAPPRSGRV
jgi:hypothetical protein